MAEPQGSAPVGRHDSPEQRAREIAWLLQIAQRGPQASPALKQLVQAYRRRLLAFFRIRGLSHHDAEDLLQDVWIRIVQKAALFDASRDPSPWIFRIAKSLWIDEMRRPARQPLELPVEDAESVPPIDDCVRRGMQRYARTDDEGAWAVQLRDLEGWGIPQMAQFLDRTEGATRTFLSQVRKKLQPFLAPCFELLSN